MEKSNLVLVDWRKYRDKFKAQILSISRLCGDKNLFDDIDKACSDERAFLFVASDGFIVLRPRHQRQQTYIDVPVAYCKGGKALERYQPTVIQLAQMGNAEFVQFYTARKGFDRLAKRLGWSKFGYHRNLAMWRYQLIK